MPRFLSDFLQILNAPIYNKMYDALNHIHANRPIESIDTLIIGDFCLDRNLKQFCHLSHALKIMFPGRSLASSKLILEHFTSVLKEGGTVIIVNGGIKDGISSFDYPFFSEVTRKELQMHMNRSYFYYPLFFAPFKSLKMTFGLVSSKFQITECPDKEVVELCCRKKFNLFYLSK